MASRIIYDKLTPKGKVLEKALKELCKNVVYVGFQESDGSYEDGVSIAQVAAFNEYGTEKIPSRPFLREGISNNQDKIMDFITQEYGKLIDGGSVQGVYDNVGLFAKDIVQDSIVSGEWAENSVYTIAKKGSSTPLIDTGLMRQSVNYVVKGGED